MVGEAASGAEALELFKLPRKLGQTAEGEPVSASVGRFGPYVQRGDARDADGKAAGLASVAERYRTGQVVRSEGVRSSSALARLKTLWAEQGVPTTLAVEGLRMDLGGGVMLAGAADAFVKFAEHMQLPVITTYMSTGGIPAAEALRNTCFAGQVLALAEEILAHRFNRWTAWFEVRQEGQWLRRGEWTIQDQIDLHGHRVDEEDTSAYRRKNMDNDDGCPYADSWGIDLNRNHSFLWGCCGGSSGQTPTRVW